jgi:hypothetical protein
MGTRWRLAALAGLFTLVTACASEGDGDGVASISASNTPSSTQPGGGSNSDGVSDIDQMRAYAKCMREHGIDMKDPDPNSSGGGGISVDSEAEKQQVDKANAACKHLMPNGGEGEKPTAEDLDQARKTAKCLREHGIEVKEPTMENPNISVDAGSGANDNDPDKLEKAMEECAPEGAQTKTHKPKGAK